MYWRAMRIKRPILLLGIFAILFVMLLYFSNKKPSLNVLKTFKYVKENAERYVNEWLSRLFRMD